MLTITALISVLVVFVFMAILNMSGTEGSVTSLYCGNDGKVIWSKSVNRPRTDILTAEGDVTVKLRPYHRYSVLSDLSLVIKNLSLLYF